MRRLLTLIALVTACGRDDRYTALRASISERESRLPGAVVGVWLHDLQDESTFGYREDSLFHAASTMKVPVMVEFFRAVEAGRLDSALTVPLENRFASVVDGSPYALDAGEDSDSSLYARVGTPVRVTELVERMITRSSNLATNAVIGLVGAARAESTARSLGARSMVVARGVEDGKAFAAGIINQASARDLGMLLTAIVTDRAASPAASQAMLGILERQEFSQEIPAGLPSGTRVAHKTGWITGVLHDAAIVFPPGGRAPFVLVVLTRGIDDRSQARALIQDVARLAWSTVPGAGGD